MFPVKLNNSTLVSLPNYIYFTGFYEDNNLSFGLIMLKKKFRTQNPKFLLRLFYSKFKFNQQKLVMSYDSK